MAKGHTRKRGSKWAYVVYERDPQTGRGRHRWYSGFSTEKAADEALRQKLTEMDKGTYRAPDRKLTVGIWLERWLDDLETSKAVGPRTLEGYSHIVKRHLVPGLGAVQLSKLSPDMIADYLRDARRIMKPKKNGQTPAYRPLSQRTLHHHHVTLHTALQAAVRRRHIGANPADNIDPPKFSRAETHTLDTGGLKAFLDAARSGEYFALFATFLHTGLRRSELLALRWGDVDLLMSQLSVRRSVHRLRDGSIVFGEPKTAKSRRPVALMPETCAVLKAHFEQQADERAKLELPALTREDLVFSRFIDGEQPQWIPLLPDTVSAAWRKLAKKSGFAGVRLHDARHTHATLMLQENIHPKIVQERLGHATISTTLDLYSHVTPGMQAAAAARLQTLLYGTDPPSADADVSNSLAEKA